MDNPFKRIEMAAGTWIVVSLGEIEDVDVGYPGEVRRAALATRSGFATREDAVRYAATINASWRPVVAQLEALRRED